MARCKFGPTPRPLFITSFKSLLLALTPAWPTIDRVLASKATMRVIQLLASLAAVGGLRLAAVRCCAGPEMIPMTPSMTAPLTSMPRTTTLHSLLTELKPLGPIRVIVVMPGASSILESVVDSSQWALNEKCMPSGKTLLTAALPDAAKSFELHLDTAVATKATLGISPKTQGPVVRVLASDGAGLLTLLPSKEKAAEFDDVLKKLGGLLTLIPTID